MQMKSLLLAGVMASALASPSALEAATLTGIAGAIFVSQGAGYMPVKKPMKVNPGDSILANPGAGAQVVFDDGCVVEVQPGKVFVVGHVSPCQAGIGTGSLKDTVVVPEEDSIALPAIAGVVAVAGGVGLIIALSDDDDDDRRRPASP